jgi:hypothetical protein|tara:strand:- start:126 stop:566 length:441 start_codon:yes stop_codon:yes gene_type:complete
MHQVLRGDFVRYAATSKHGVAVPVGDGTEFALVKMLQSRQIEKVPVGALRLCDKGPISVRHRADAGDLTWEHPDQEGWLRSENARLRRVIKAMKVKEEVVAAAQAQHGAHQTRRYLEMRFDLDEANRLLALAGPKSATSPQEEPGS